MNAFPKGHNFIALEVTLSSLHISILLKTLVWSIFLSLIVDDPFVLHLKSLHVKAWHRNLLACHCELS